MRLDAFLKLTRPGQYLPGESTDADFGNNTIEILSFGSSLEVAARIDAAQNAQAPAAIHEPFKFVKPVDSATAGLLELVSKRYQDVVILVELLQRTGDSTGASNTWTREAYLSIKLEGCFVVRTQIVLDPRIQDFGEGFTRDPDVLAMGPLQYVEVIYKKSTFWYGENANSVEWTHPQYNG